MAFLVGRLRSSTKRTWASFALEAHLYSPCGKRKSQQLASTFSCKAPTKCRALRRLATRPR